MAELKPSEVIRKARNIMFERGWSQGHTMADDGSVCMVGAMNLAMGRHARSTTTRTHVPALDGPVIAAIDGRFIFHWNDTPGRTFDEVIEAFDKAEKIAEEREAAS